LEEGPFTVDHRARHLLPGEWCSTRIADRRRLTWAGLPPLPRRRWQGNVRLGRSGFAGALEKESGREDGISHASDIPWRDRSGDKVDHKGTKPAAPRTGLKAFFLGIRFSSRGWTVLSSKLIGLAVWNGVFAGLNWGVHFGRCRECTSGKECPTKWPAHPVVGHRACLPGGLAYGGKLLLV